MELGIRRDDKEAISKLGKILEGLFRLTDNDGRYITDEVEKHSLLKNGIMFYDDKLRGDYFNYPCRDRGRLIMALTQVYRRLGDVRALALAHRFVRLVRSTAFTEDGRLTHLTGPHTHSITGTVQGLADYGFLSGDLDTLEHAIRIFNTGLPATCSSFGWSVENCWREKIIGRGEVNNTGDMVQTALIFGRAGCPEYFETAERMIRSHVLPTQWLIGQEFHNPDTSRVEFPQELSSDEDGGWGCPGVNDRYCNSRFGILDITQGGIQCLWSALKNAISEELNELRINQFFSHSEAGIKALSHLPLEGLISIKTKERKNIWIRLPSWLNRNDVLIKVNGKPISVSCVEGWLIVPPHSHEEVEVAFPLEGREETEWVNHKPYRIFYEGDGITAMDPKGTCAPMYPSISEIY